MDPKLIAILFFVNCLFTKETALAVSQPGDGDTVLTVPPPGDKKLPTTDDARKMDTLRAIRIREYNKIGECQNISVKGLWTNKSKRCTNYGCVLKNTTDEKCSPAGTNAFKETCDKIWSWKNQSDQINYADPNVSKKDIEVEECFKFVQENREACSDYFHYKKDTKFCQCVPRYHLEKPQLVKNKDYDAYELLSPCQSLVLPTNKDSRPNYCGKRGCVYDKNTESCADVQCRDIYVPNGAGGIPVPGVASYKFWWIDSQKFCGAHDCIYNTGYSKYTCDVGKCEDVQLKNYYMYYPWLPGHCAKMGCHYNRKENKCSTEPCSDKLPHWCKFWGATSWRSCNTPWYDENCQQYCNQC